MSPSEAAHMDRLCALQREIAAISPAAGALAVELANLECERAAAREDEILRRVGLLLLENDQADIWREVYAAQQAANGCAFEPGDERRFLHREPGWWLAPQPASGS
jgi:hypothetical protein